MENEKFEYEQEIKEESAAVEEIVSEYREAPQQPRQESYSGAGVGRKESPFANSPYEMNFNYEPKTYEPKFQKVKAKKTGSGRGRRILAAVAALALLVGSCSITAAIVNNRWERKTQLMEQNINQKLEDLRSQVDMVSKNPGGVTVVDSLGNMSTGSVYAQNVQSVVLITCEVAGSAYFGQTTTGTSTGTGFIITEDGYVVTNYHVVEGASKIYVNTHEGDEFSAVLVGQDKTNDVAVLKMEDAANLPYVTLGSSTELAVGDQVVAIGNPLGDLTATLTVGYVSAKDRDVTTEGATINMIQTDAAINSGNSGGPLFNMKGEVVGITTAKYSGSSASGATIEGIGFAIPIDDVSDMIDDLINYGYVTGAYLGVMVSDMDKESADYYGMPMGAYVQEVTPGYAAEKAGLKVKDIIVALGDHQVTSVNELTRALRNFEAGETTTLTIYRSGMEQVLSITLDEKPQETTTAAPATTESMPESGSFEEWYNYFAPYFGNPMG